MLAESFCQSVGWILQHLHDSNFPPPAEKLHCIRHAQFPEQHLAVFMCADGRPRIFVSGISEGSVADIDGRIRKGDQIIAVSFFCRL